MQVASIRDELLNYGDVCRELTVDIKDDRCFQVEWCSKSYRLVFISIMPILSVMTISVTAVAVRSQASSTLGECFIAGSTSQTYFIVSELGHKVKQTKSVLSIKV